jgi:hypothetical protein
MDTGAPKAHDGLHSCRFTVSLRQNGVGTGFIRADATRVLAGNESEKSKNGPLALASERRRRVESAPSPMKKDPNQNSTDSAEIEALINRLERGQLRDEEGGHE